MAIEIKLSNVSAAFVINDYIPNTRHDHQRDLNIRTSLRRDEAREQSERHRLQMEMMLDRVTQIPTLFERH